MMLNAGPSGIIDQAGLIFIAHGDTMPSDGTNGYAPGCLFVDTDSRNFYSNVGDDASCKFRLATPSPVVNCASHGAVGDGVTDDAAAIQAALNAAAAAGMPCFLPPGTYMISATLVIPSNADFYGAGPESVIKLSDAGEAGLTGTNMNEVLGTSKPPIYAMLLTSQAAATTGIHLHDFAIDGNDAAIQTANHLISFAGLALYDTSNCYVERVDIADCNKSTSIVSPGDYRSFCLLIAKASDVTVSGGTFGNAGYETLGIRGGCTDINIDGCRIIKSGTTEYGRHGIQISTGDAGLPISRVRIANCYLYGDRCEIISHGIDNLLIEGNIVYATMDSGQCLVINVADYVIVQGNFFNSVGALCIGISIVGAAGDTCSHVTIANNLIRSTSYGIDVGTGNNFTICGNHIVSTNRNAIEVYINSPANDTISDFQIYGNCLVVTTNYDNYCYGLHLRAVQRAIVRDNVMYPPANWGAMLMTDGDGHYIVNNRFQVSGSGVGIVEATSPTWAAYGNKGYVSENSGTATVPNGATYIDVTHGLAYTPTAAELTIIPTLLSSAASWWVTDIGATTFRINVNADPGAGTATFSWSARRAVVR